MKWSARGLLVAVSVIMVTTLAAIGVFTYHNLQRSGELLARYDRLTAITRDLGQMESALNGAVTAGDEYLDRLHRVLPGHLAGLADQARDGGWPELAAMMDESGVVLRTWKQTPREERTDEFSRYIRAHLMTYMYRATDEADRLAIEQARGLQAYNRGSTQLFALAAAAVVMATLLSLALLYISVMRPLGRMTPVLRSGEAAAPLVRGPFTATEVKGLAMAYDHSRAALVESEERFRRAVESAPFPTIIFAENGKVLAVNEVWSEFTGYQGAEISTLAKWVELAYEEDRRGQVMAGIHRLFDAEGRVDEGEFTIRCRDGRRRNWEFSSTNLGRGPGGLRVVVGMAVDVTERRAAEEALRRSEYLLRETLDSLSEAVFVVGPEYRTVRMCNRAATTVFGFPEADLLARGIRQLHVDDAHYREFAQRSEQVLEAGGKYTGEFEMRRASGEVFPTEHEIRPIAPGTHWRTGVVSVVRDISERVAAERERERQRGFLRAILENSADGVVACDGRGRPRLFNRTARALLHATTRQLESEAWPDGCTFIRADDETPFDPDDMPLTRICRGEEIHNTEMVIVADGSPPRTVLVSGKPIIEDAGTRLGAVISLHDITKRRRAERALRASNERLEQRVAERTGELSVANERLKELDRLKSMFIASMSHELRTPLNSIIGFTGLLLMDDKGRPDEQRRDYLNRIRRSGNHLLNLVSDIIDLSKVEAGSVRPVIESVAVEAVVDEAISTLAEQAARKGIAIRREGVEGVVVTTDRRRFLQCLFNLLSNAVKYTLEGGITIDCVRDDDGITLSVTDTGIGIHPDDIPRLFQQFSRIDTPVGRSTLGTGLGLYLTRKLATEVLGGDVGVESRPGSGSRFWLRVPDVESDVRRRGTGRGGSD